jgi:hypothetical protein
MTPKKKRHNRNKKQNRKQDHRNLFAIFATLLTGLFVVIGVLEQLPELFKAGIWDNDVVLSKPVGTDILPGGGLEAADDVKGSFIFTKLIPFAIDYGIKLAIGLCVVVLMFGGYQFMTAYGNTDKQGAARKTIIYALIGLILALTAYGLIAILTSIELS